MSLAQDVEKFLYTHAQSMPYKGQLLTIVRIWEKGYLEKIEDLRQQLADVYDIENEGGTKHEIT